MPKMTFLSVSIEDAGDDCLNQSIAIFLDKFLGERPADAPSNHPAASDAGQPARLPAAPAELPEIPAPDARRQHAARQRKLAQVVTEQRVTSSWSRAKRTHVTCQERPGELMTIAEAIALAGGKESSLKAALSPSSKTAGKHRAFHFKWAEAPENGRDYEARPRHSGNSAPLNHQIRGGAARTIPQD
jgi:hypothetical protein